VRQRRADPLGRERRPRLGEARELHRAEPRVVEVGVGEMGHHPDDAHPGHRREAPGHRGELVEGDAQARHPRVDLEVDRDRPARRGPRELVELRGVVHHRGDVVRQRGLEAVAVQARERQHRRAQAPLSHEIPSSTSATQSPSAPARTIAAPTSAAPWP
jgi:hypothetical protein